MSNMCAMATIFNIFSSVNFSHVLRADDLQVGKWGLTTNCITAISDALEANELVKVILFSCVYGKLLTSV